MVGALVGAIVGSLLSVSLKAAYDKLTSPEVANYFKRKNNDLLLTKLKMLLNSADAVLIDAEEKQITNSVVKKWLDDLRDAVYVADDLLDDIGTEALVAEFSDDNEVRKFLSDTFNSFDNRIKSDLKKIFESEDAKEVNLKDKKYLSELELQWGRGHIISQDGNEIDVLKHLCHHTNLKSLTIRCYYGKTFPNWLGDTSFSNMVSLKLCDCECCLALPPLGSLPVLKKLSIEGFNDVVNVDKEFYRNDSITTTPFKSLETLTFKTMPKWKEWATFEGDIFSTLRELHIINCPVLIGNLPKTLPSLTVLEITNCKPLVASLSSFMALRELHLTDCDKVQLRKVPTSLQSLTIGGCHTPLPMGGLPGTLKSLVISGILQLSRDYSSPSVETLKVKKGPGLLWSLPLELFPKLKRVEMLDCEHLQSLSTLEQSCQSLTSLTCLEIKNCRNFVSFPRSGLCAPNLRKIEVSDCQKLKSLPDSMALILIRCPELESVAGCRSLSVVNDKCLTLRSQFHATASLIL
ncbi:putative disease resistance RPP13-like protein 1 [Quercus robur]|uniref:putative disease resistance RPP13-like protein 1 n=1 Tax=Quercus robur TaxID=38942 RepID=UPI0021629C4B|nr:putative disease resistance RPP13-like protein 1 [Quercus robur]